jgi:hypothetical protein
MKEWRCSSAILDLKLDGSGELLASVALLSRKKPQVLVDEETG